MEGSEFLENGRGSGARGAELERLRLALLASGDAVYDWDTVSDEIVWSEGAVELFGLGDLGVPDLGAISDPRGFERRIAVADLPARARALFGHVGGQRTYDYAYRLKRADGTLTWVQDRGMAVASREGRIARMVGSLHRIPQPAAVRSGLTDVGAFDSLTGHVNRARLGAALD